MKMSSGRVGAATKFMLGVMLGAGLVGGGCQTADGDKAAEGSPRESREARPAPKDSAHDVLGTPAKRTGEATGTRVGGIETGGAPAAKAEAPDPNASKWVIVLATVKAESASGAADALEYAQNKAGLSDAYLTKRGSTTVLAVGAFDDRADEAATKAMQRVRSASVDGSYPFAKAFLSPPVLQGTPGINPELDLSNAKATYGDKRAEVTLQVGIYCRLDDQKPSKSELAEFRKAAETAAMELRRGGELAFYYHGPERSTVTVGLFTQKDLNDGTGSESDDLKEARQKHPSALVNGMGLRQSEIVPGSSKKKGDLQPSFLVTVPKK